MRDEGIGVPGYTPRYRLPSAWNCARAGLILLPLWPALGAVGLGLALASTGWQRYRQIVLIPFNWGLALLGLWLVINSCIAYSRTESFLGLANFLPFLALLAVFGVLIRPNQLRQLAWLIVLPSLLVVVFGLGQLLGDWETPKLFLSVFGWQLVAGGEPEGRMSSVFMYANILAAYLLIVLVLGLGLWIDTFRNRQSKYRGWLLLLLTVVFVGDSLGLIGCSSRNAWLLAVLAGLAFALYLGWRWLVLGVVVAAGSTLWASFGPTVGQAWLRRIVPAFIWLRLSDQLYPDRPLPSLRITQWQFAWEMAQQRPWTGWGLRSFTPLYEAQTNWWLGHPHSLFLMLLAEIGILGTLLFCSLVGWQLARAILLIKEQANQLSQSDRLILFTYLVAFSSCTLFNLFDVTVFDLRVNILGWLLFAAICGVVQHYQVRLRHS